MTTPDPALGAFHPLVQRWFTETLGEPSLPQRRGWPAIASGSDTLILAPTGTGKTLSAFLYEVDALIREGQAAPLANAVHLLYISPLKALSNDVQRNLDSPLAELRTRFIAAGEHFPDIRVAVRTGDTSSAARARMIRRTPHILITTPESLHLLLTSVSGRSMFSALRAVIVDEIHAIAGTKRGAHLALTLERLRDVSPAAPQRIGLSATQRPLDEVARFLGGCAPAETGDSKPRFRPVEIIDCGLVKPMQVDLISPVPDLAQVDGSIWPAVVPLVLEQMQRARTTLVFVNNRGQAERMAGRINAAAGEEVALPYHGSLSRDRRLLLEERLKHGELRALVTTSSLELGIDVGSVDLVIQLQSPKRVASALQRVGRAGHTLGAASCGVMVPTFRDDAMEQMAIVHAMLRGDVEPTRVVQNALDVLAQLLVTMVASDDREWTASALFDFVRQAYPYHDLSRGAFDETLAMLAGRYPADVAAELDARLFWDRSTDLLTPARSARMLATISGGTIPDRGLYTVYLADKTRLGELDEEFVHESRVGDVFQLGSSTWRIRTIEHDRVTVIPAPGAPARMPFWHGEFMARAFHLSPVVGALRRALTAASDDAAQLALQAEYHSDAATVRSLVDYVTTQAAITGVVPDEKQLVLEYFRDEVGSVRMVLHAPFGGRVNAPWGMALGRRMRERLGIDVQVQTTDDGIMLRLPQLSGAPPVDVIRQLTAVDARQLVLEEVGNSSLFGARFRMNAARALLLPRGNPRKRMPLWLQRLKAADLLEAVRQFPSFPVVVETYRDVLQDAFDMDGLDRVLQQVASGAIALRVVETALPSPFAQSLQFGFVIDWMYGDDTPRAEARAAMLSLDQVMLDELLGGEGADDATLAMLESVLARRRGTADGFQARDADELSILLDRAGDLSWEELQARVAPPAAWSRGDPAAMLRAAQRIVAIDIAGTSRWIMADTRERYSAACDTRSPASDVEREAAREAILARWVALAGPVTVADAVARYGFDADSTERWFRRLEEARVLVRGAFGGDRRVLRWCSRKLLERARRAELKQVRASIAPVTLGNFTHFMQRWQHVRPDAHLDGDDALDQVMQQLAGLARPPLHWERDYLPSRIPSYAATDLDRLMAQGRLVWAMQPRGVSGELLFFARGSGRLWLAPLPARDTLTQPAQAVWSYLQDNGASFIDEIAAGAALSPNKTRDAIHELVLAGVATSDTASGMRDVIRWRRLFPSIDAAAPDPARWLPDTFVVQRRVNPRRLARWRRPELVRDDGWSGRWSLLHTANTLGPVRDEADAAAEIAEQWLARYGLVSRECWGRERPSIGWRAIYHELKRLEFRGDVQRGYFVDGLAGAQFAVPAAVEWLRENDDDASMVAVAATDPANIYAWPLRDRSLRDPIERPRGRGGVLVTEHGVPVLAAEHRGRRLRVGGSLTTEQFRPALVALIEALGRNPGRRGREVVLESIDGIAPMSSPWHADLVAAGLREQPNGMRYP